VGAAVEAEAAFAFVARRQGAPSMPPSRWEHLLSLEMGWMTPGQAKTYVQRALEAGVLVEEGGELRMRRDPRSVEVPRGFRPDPGAVMERPEAPADPFLGWVDRVAEARGQDRAAVLEEVARRQDRLHGLLDAQAAVLRLAHEAGLDVAEAARAAEQGLRRRG